MSAPARPAPGLAARNAWMLAALLPGFGLQFRRDGAALLATLALALVAALVFEAVALRLRRQPLAPFLREGSAMFHAAVLVAWLPLAPAWVLLVALFAALVLARQAFGGLARNLFHPAAVAVAPACLLAPSAMPPPTADLELAFAWLLGGAFLPALRIVRWQGPVFLLAGGLLGGIVAGGGEALSFASPLWVLAAFFVAGDSITTPENPRMRALAAGLAGLAAGLGGAAAPMLLPFALLAMHIATPALDAWRPATRRPVAAP